MNYNDAETFNSLAHANASQWYKYLEDISDNVKFKRDEVKETDQQIEETQILQKNLEEQFNCTLNLTVDVEVRRRGYRYKISINGVYINRYFYIYYEEKLLDKIEVNSKYSYFPIIGQLSGIAAIYPGWREDVEVNINIIDNSGPVVMTDLQEEKFKFVFYERMIAHRGVYNLDYNKNRKVTFNVMNRVFEDDNTETTPNKALLFFSLGKESTLTRYILENVLKFDTLPVLIEEGGYGSIKRNQQLEKPHNSSVHKINSNIKQIYNVFRNKLLWVSGGDHIELNFGFFMYDLTKKLSISNLVVGNEIDSTKFNKTKQGDVHLHKVLFDTGIHYEKFTTSFYNDGMSKNSEFNFYSVLPIYEINVVDVLNKVMPDFTSKIVSCWSPSTRYTWCGKCEKCCRLTMIFSLLNIESPAELQETLVSDWKKVLEKDFNSWGGQFNEETRNLGVFSYRVKYMPEYTQAKLLEFYSKYLNINDQIIHSPDGTSRENKLEG